MNVHRFIVLLACFLVNEAGTETLDLHSCSRLLLDIFHEHTLEWTKHNEPQHDVWSAYRRSDNLGTDVEVPDGL